MTRSGFQGEPGAVGVVVCDASSPDLPPWIECRVSKVAETVSSIDGYFSGLGHLVAGSVLGACLNVIPTGPSELQGGLVGRIFGQCHACLLIVPRNAQVVAFRIIALAGVQL